MILKKRLVKYVDKKTGENKTFPIIYIDYYINGQPVEIQVELKTDYLIKKLILDELDELE